MHSPTNFHIAILDGKPETIKSRKRREWANARHSLSPLRILDLQLFLGAQDHSKPRLRDNLLIAGSVSLFLSLVLVFALEYVHGLRMRKIAA